jgi:tetratricopeptide (TPR) repeat protein
MVLAQLKLAPATAERLRAALRLPGFEEKRARFLDGAVIDTAAYPNRAALCWNRRERFLPPEEEPALGVRGFVRAVVERDLVRGLADLDCSVHIDPRYWTTRLMRGWALVAARRVPDAVADLRAALDINPWATWCHGALAQYVWYNGEAEAGLSLARDAVRSFPNVDANLFTLSQIASWLGHHEEAIAAGRRARELAPDTPPMHTALACALAWAGKARRGARGDPRDRGGRSSAIGALARRRLARPGEAEARWRCTPSAASRALRSTSTRSTIHGSPRCGRRCRRGRSRRERRVGAPSGRRSYRPSRGDGETLLVPAGPRKSGQRRRR